MIGGLEEKGSRLFLRCLSVLTCSKSNQLSCRCRSDEVGSSLQIPACLTLASQAARSSGKWRSPKISSTGSGQSPSRNPKSQLAVAPCWPGVGAQFYGHHNEESLLRVLEGEGTCSLSKVPRP